MAAGRGGHAAAPACGGVCKQCGWTARKSTLRFCGACGVKLVKGDPTPAESVGKGNGKPTNNPNQQPSKGGGKGGESKENPVGAIEQLYDKSKELAAQVADRDQRLADLEAKLKKLEGGAAADPTPGSSKGATSDEASAAHFKAVDDLKHDIGLLKGMRGGEYGEQLAKKEAELARLQAEWRGAKPIEHQIRTNENVLATAKKALAREVAAEEAAIKAHAEAEQALAAVKEAKDRQRARVEALEKERADLLAKHAEEAAAGTKNVEAEAGSQALLLSAEGVLAKLKDHQLDQDAQQILDQVLEVARRGARLGTTKAAAGAEGVADLGPRPPAEPKAGDAPADASMGLDAEGQDFLQRLAEAEDEASAKAVWEEVRSRKKRRLPSVAPAAVGGDEDAVL